MRISKFGIFGNEHIRKNIFKKNMFHEYIHRIGKSVKFGELAFGKLAQRPCWKVGRGGCQQLITSWDRPNISLSGIFPRTGRKNMNSDSCTILSSPPLVKPLTRFCRIQFQPPPSDSQKETSNPFQNSQQPLLWQSNHYLPSRFRHAKHDSLCIA